MDCSRDRDAADSVDRLDSTITALAELMARRRGGRLISCAETFTGGLLSGTLTDVADSDDWFVGGVVVRTAGHRRSVLGVTSPDEVSEGCAVQMALGTARLFGTPAAVATTGVASFGSVEHGPPPGTVVVGWVVDGAWGASTVELPGSARDVALRAVRTALTSLSRAMVEADEPVARDQVS